MELKEIQCKNCGAPLERSDMAWELGVAKCSHCGSIFGLEKFDSSVQATPIVRHPVPMPDGITIEHPDGGLKITYRWFNVTYAFMLVFAIFWNVFTWGWQGVSLVAGNLLFSAFGLFHVVIGLFLLYYGLAGILNRTLVGVHQDRLIIHHEPLPWPGSKQLPATAIEQLYSKEKIHHSKNGISITYEVSALTRDKTKEKLVGRLKELEQALYIEQEIERHLGIRDQPVRGEVPR